MKDIKLILFFVILFITIRSIHFSEYLNFSFDQAWASTRALEIWQNKEFTLVGPGNSIIANGKQMIQGSVNYYYQLIFLLLGRFDPIVSSYFLMVLMGLMIVPLYYGVEFLFDKKVAVFIVLLFTLLPFYIDFSRFIFGPVFQLSLLPLLILFMGLYKKFKKQRYLFLVFFLTGILLQFHYQIIAFMIILALYYLWKSKKKTKKIMIMTTGFIIGYLPMIAFEVKNQLYNIKILLEYLKFSKTPSDFFFVPHRFLVISFLLLVISAPLYKKFLNTKKLIGFGLILFIVDLMLYLPTPKKAFGMSKNWNYPMEKKAYEIIKKENLKYFNIVNHIYDNKSVVIKYHLKLDKYDFDYDDYYHNRYLFVVSSTDKIFKDPAYEIKTFQPNKKLKEWKLNDIYNLYLFERITKESIEK